jgi:uncharacterized protein
MPRLYLKNSDVRSSYPVSSWQTVLFSEFEAQMCSDARPFPCVFGVAGYRQDQLRYLFLDPIDVNVLGEQLALFVSEARSHGPNTSLVLFTRPRPVQTLDAYYKKFWRTLDELARIDKSPWPAEIPETVDHPMWEFSFAGEPIFVVCSLIPFDTTSPSPLLGRYGDPEGREYSQYFLHDDNQPASECPFHRLAQTKTPPIEDTEQAA